MIAIDETNLVSEWAAFRNAFSELKELKHMFCDIPIMALSATALSEAVFALYKVASEVTYLNVFPTRWLSNPFSKATPTISGYFCQQEAASPISAWHALFRTLNHPCAVVSSGSSNCVSTATKNNSTCNMH